MLPSSPATESNPSANPGEENTPVSVTKEQYSAKFKSQVVQIAKSNRVVAASTVEVWTKQAKESTLVVSDGKERMSSRYTPELKAEVLEFAVRNSNIATSRQFNIPESTLRGWIMKAVKAGDFKRDYDKTLVISEVEDCIMRSTESSLSGNIANKTPLIRITNQKGISLMIDIPSVNGSLDDTEKVYGSVSKETNQELENDDAIEEKEVESITSSKRNRYSNSFRKKVVKFGEWQGWKAAAEKFGVSANTVGVWARLMGKRLSKKVDDETKDEIVKFGLNHKSWTSAAKKFGVSAHTVAFWGKKAGYKLQTGVHNREGKNDQESKDTQRSDGFEEKVVKFGEENGWKAAAEQFGLKVRTVTAWARRLGKSFPKNVVDETKDEIVKYGLQQNSWRAAADHYGKSPHTVANWGRKAGYKLKGGRHNKKDMTEITDQEAVQVLHSSLVNNISDDNSFEQCRENSIQVETSLGGENNNHDTFSQEMIQEAVVFADTNGLKAAARKFGVANHVVFKWSKKYKGGSAESDASSPTTDQIGISADNDSKKHTAQKVRKVQLVLKSDADTVTGFNFDHSPVNGNSASSGLDASGKIADSAVLPTSYPENSVTPLLSQSPTTAACCPEVPEPDDKCEACGTLLAADETHTEHVVSVHLTIEGLCDICGEDAEDFVEHFKIHLKSCRYQDVTPPLDIVKTEFVDKADIIQNMYDNMDEDTVVKEEAVEDEGRWVLNPFYKSS